VKLHEVERSEELIRKVACEIDRGPTSFCAAEQEQKWPSLLNVTYRCGNGSTLTGQCEGRSFPIRKLRNLRWPNDGVLSPSRIRVVEYVVFQWLTYGLVPVRRVRGSQNFSSPAVKQSAAPEIDVCRPPERGFGIEASRGNLSAQLRHL
jgi:hypothetical protein